MVMSYFASVSNQYKQNTSFTIQKENTMVIVEYIAMIAVYGSLGVFVGAVGFGGN